jgi:hypothetical protein
MGFWRSIAFLGWYGGLFTEILFDITTMTPLSWTLSLHVDVRCTMTRSIDLYRSRDSKAWNANRELDLDCEMFWTNRCPRLEQIDKSVISRNLWPDSMNWRAISGETSSNWTGEKRIDPPQQIPKPICRANPHSRRSMRRATEFKTSFDATIHICLICPFLQNEL